MIFHYNYNSESLIATVTGLIISFVFLLTPWVRFIKLRAILKSAQIISAQNKPTLLKEES